MNKHSRTFRYLIFFIVVFVHITLLNLFVVNTDKALIFYWQEAIKPLTILVHLGAATLSLMVFIAVDKLLTAFSKSRPTLAPLTPVNRKIGKPIYLLCSVLMAAMIGVLLL